MKASYIYTIWMLLGLFCTANAQDDLKLCPSMEVIGDEININVTVENFEEMVSFQFAIAWNNWDYEFVGVEELNPDLAYFDGGAVSPLLDTLYDKVDLIRFSWFNPFGTSSLDDGKKLFSIKVKPLRDVVDANFGVFEDRDFMMEFVDASIKTIPVIIDSEGCNVFSIEGITSVKEELQTKIEIYPNPSKDIVNIDFDEPFEGTISVLNLQGKKVYSQQVKRTSKESLQLKKLEAGEYFLHLEDQDGKIKTKGITIIK